MLKPSRQDLHRKIVELANLTQEQTSNGYFSARQMTELIVYIEFLKKQLAVNNLLKDLNEANS